MPRPPKDRVVEEVTPIGFSRSNEPYILPNTSNVKSGAIRGAADPWVLKTGDTMTGNLALGTNNITTVGSITATANISTTANITATLQITGGYGYFSSSQTDGTMQIQVAAASTDPQLTIISNGGAVLLGVDYLGQLYSDSGDVTVGDSLKVTGAVDLDSTLNVDGSVTINEAGSATVDVRIEGDTNTNLFFTDASADRIGINNSAPANAKIDVTSNTIIGNSSQHFYISNDGVNNNSYLSSNAYYDGSNWQKPAAFRSAIFGSAGSAAAKGFYVYTSASTTTGVISDFSQIFKVIPAEANILGNLAVGSNTSAPELLWLSHATRALQRWDTGASTNGWMGSGNALFAGAASTDFGILANTNLILGDTAANATLYLVSNKVHVGSRTTPTAVLHLKAGTATANTAPLKFTSGTNLTAAEAGAMEYDGTELYFSPSTTRRKLGIVTAGGSTIASGTYSPTRSAEVNMDANVTMTQAQYMRVGDTVTVSGRFTANPTLTATATSFEIDLPVASNIGAAEDCAGTAFSGSIAGQGAEIIGSVANNTAVIQWVAGDVTSQLWSYTFTYQVI